MKSIINNKRAYFEYHIIEKFTAGIQLKGSEVKSIKSGKVSIVESYCFINNGELFIKGMHVSEHKEGAKNYNHQPIRDRKLLMKKKEILNLLDDVGKKGLTIIPLEVFISNTGFIKIQIGLAKGKQLHDKRNSIKEKDLKRDLERNNY